MYFEDGLGLGSGFMYEDQRGKDSSRFGGADPQLEPLEPAGHRRASHTEGKGGGASAQILQRRDG